MELRRLELNVDQSLQLHRRLGAGRDKTFLELALAGGMLTRERCHRHRGEPHIWCPMGCRMADTEYHRYWECEHTASTRPALPDEWQQWPLVTKLTGWSTTQHPVNTSLLISIQRHMLQCIKFFTQAFNNERRQHDPGHDDGHDRTGNDNETGRGYASDHEGEDYDDDGDDHDNGGGGDSYSLSVHVRSGRRTHSQPGTANGLSSGMPEQQLQGLRDTGDETKENAVQASLPDHIQLGQRTLVGVQGYEKKLLRCRACGATGAYSRNAQFLQQHGGCVGLTDTFPLFPLTDSEKRLLQEAGAFDFSAKRRRNSHCTLYTDRWPHD